MNAWFANPWALWLTAVIPSLGMLFVLAWRKRKRALAMLGALHGLVLVQRGPRVLRTLCTLLGVTLLVIGAAGPQWDVDTNPDALAGPSRDLVVVLDLSRSMLAEQPSRQELALRGLRDLCDTLKRRGGGHRVALVIFAGRPKLVFPLTNDFDHLAESLTVLDADHLPSDMRPDQALGETSGTRIGAALRKAVDAHDPQMEGAQDIILLSDGDDPVADAEWLTGVEPARAKKIPIHCVGLGTPKFAAFIPLDADVVRDDNGKPITSELREKPLQEIARQTRGVHIPAHADALPLGRLYQEIVASRPVREAQAGDMGAVIIYQQRYEWFLAGALVLLAGSIVIPDRGFRRRSPSGARGLRLALIPLALVLISAAPIERFEELLGQGNAAFAAEAYADALNYYQQAEDAASDPGLVAFNKAACHYRLGQYQRAEDHYRRCLEDQEIPGPRQARAWYDLANSLVQKKPSTVYHLGEALHCYRRCLAHADATAELRTDAAHNLHLAKLLWLKLKAEQKDSRDYEPPKEDNEDKKYQTVKDQKKLPKKIEEKKEDLGSNEQATEKDFGKGLFSLPDKDEVQPLPPEATEHLLDEAARRIRHAWRRPPGPPSTALKDW